LAKIRIIFSFLGSLDPDSQFGSKSTDPTESGSGTLEKLNKLAGSKPKASGAQKQTNSELFEDRMLSI
jgi:hypothetical protein